MLLFSRTAVLNFFSAATHLNDIHILGTPSWQYQNFNYIKINNQKWTNITITNCQTYNLQTNYDQYEQMVKFLVTDIATAGVTSVCSDTVSNRYCSTAPIWNLTIELMKVNIQLDFLNISFAQKQKSFKSYELLLMENEKPELKDVHTELFLLITQFIFYH